MQALEMEMPEAWQTQANNQPKIAVYDMIIDNMGITMLAQATSVLQFPDAKVADLIASIDTVHVELIANSLIEAGVKGRIGLPVSKKDSIQNPLEYVALFNNPQLPGEPVSFQLTVSPTGPVNAHMLKGELELAQTSNIMAHIEKDKKTFDIDLDGEFKWTNITLGPVKSVNMGSGLSGSGHELRLNQRLHKWASTLAAGPLPVPKKCWPTSRSPSMKLTTPCCLPSRDSSCADGVNFDVIFNLTSDIGGMSGLGVEFAIEDNTGGQKFHPQYIGTQIDSISVHANLSAVNIKGAIGFRNDDPVYGNGFIGELSAEFKAVGIQVSALAEFGNTAYQNNNEIYRYWRVEAGVVLACSRRCIYAWCSLQRFWRWRLLQYGGGPFGHHLSFHTPKIVPRL
jgi:hypothetical protein